MRYRSFAHVGIPLGVVARCGAALPIFNLGPEPSLSLCGVASALVGVSPIVSDGPEAPGNDTPALDARSLPTQDDSGRRQDALLLSGAKRSRLWAAWHGPESARMLVRKFGGSCVSGFGETKPASTTRHCIWRHIQYRTQCRLHVRPCPRLSHPLLCDTPGFFPSPLQGRHAA